MLETRKLGNKKIRKALFVVKPTSIRYVTDMRYLEEYSGSTGVSQFSVTQVIIGYNMIRHVTFGYLIAWWALVVTETVAIRLFYQLLYKPRWNREGNNFSSDAWGWMEVLRGMGGHGSKTGRWRMQNLRGRVMRMGVIHVSMQASW